MLDLLADEVEGHARRKHQIADPRNPVTGTKLLREWDGAEHTVTVLKDGFDCVSSTGGRNTLIFLERWSVDHEVSSAYILH
jgi:hypothetical protein